MTCHDGTPLDANDVKYTIDAAFDETTPSVTKGSWGPITSAEVVDPLTVRPDAGDALRGVDPVPGGQLLIDHLRHQRRRVRHHDRDRIRAVEAGIVDQGRPDRS